MSIIDRDRLTSGNIFQRDKDSFFNITDHVGIAGMENFTHKVRVVDMRSTVELQGELRDRIGEKSSEGRHGFPLTKRLEGDNTLADRVANPADFKIVTAWLVFKQGYGVGIESFHRSRVW